MSGALVLTNPLGFIGRFISGKGVREMWCLRLRAWLKGDRWFTLLSSLCAQVWRPRGSCWPVSVCVCSFLRSKVDASSYMIPETYPVHSSWWETRNVVNGCLMLLQIKKKGLGILIPSLFCLSLILCLKYLQCEITSQLGDWQGVQYNPMPRISSYRGALPPNHTGGFWFPLRTASGVWGLKAGESFTFVSITATLPIL